MKYGVILVSKCSGYIVLVRLISVLEKLEGNDKRI